VAREDEATDASRSCTQSSDGTYIGIESEISIKAWGKLEGPIVCLAYECSTQTFRGRRNQDVRGIDGGLICGALLAFVCTD
jgi:hypothetical protein